MRYEGSALATLVLTAGAVILLSGTVSAQTPQADYVERRIDLILGRDWDYKTVSSGRNFPAVNVRREHRGKLLILLHEAFTPQDIRRHFDWDQKELQRRLGELEQAELIRREDERWVPTVAVISAGDDARYFPVPESIVSRTAAAIETILPEVRRIYRDTPGLAKVPFNKASLYVLSNVLLDDIQIDYVEDRFMGTERPLRAGSRFYYSIREDIPWDSVESLGVYGNSIRSYGPFYAGVYGNRRQNNPLNFLALDADGLEALFSIRPETQDSLKEEALGHIVAAARDPAYAMPPAFSRGFESLGWLEEGDVVIPILAQDDRASLERMALVFTEELLALMKEYRPVLVEAHRDSPYGDEITFEEYFMWWYHKYYSRVTDRLIAARHIVLPDAGIVSYVYAPAEFPAPKSVGEETRDKGVLFRHRIPRFSQSLP